MRIKIYIYLILGTFLIGYLLGYNFTYVPYKLNNYPTVFAHRGVTINCVENSVEAFKLADKFDFNAIETDVTITKDKVPIIFHDDNCKRLIGIDTLIGTVSYNYIKDKPLLYNGVKTNNTILTLKNFIKDIQRNKTIYFDIKKPSKILADSLISYLKIYGKYDKSLIADGNIFFLAYLKYKNPKIRTVLEGFNKGKELLFYIIPHKYRPDFYSSFFSQVDNNHINFLKRNNLLQQKIVYGIDKSNIQNANNIGVKNIIVDFDTSMLKNKIISKKHLNNATVK